MFYIFNINNETGDYLIFKWTLQRSTARAARLRPLEFRVYNSHLGD